MGQTANSALVASKVALLGSGIEEIANPFTVCGLFKVAENLDTLSMAMRESEKADFFTDIIMNTAAADDVKAMIKYGEAGDVFSAGVYTGRFFSMLIEKSQPTGTNDNAARMVFTYFA